MLLIMIEHWYTDYSLCNFGPFPWGDRIVDAQDLIVLAEHMASNPADVNSVKGPRPIDDECEGLAVRATVSPSLLHAVHTGKAQSQAL